MRQVYNWTPEIDKVLLKGYESAKNKKNWLESQAAKLTNITENQLLNRIAYLRKKKEKSVLKFFVPTLAKSLTEQEVVEQVKRVRRQSIKTNNKLSSEWTNLAKQLADIVRNHKEFNTNVTLLQMVDCFTREKGIKKEEKKLEKTIPLEILGSRELYLYIKALSTNTNSSISKEITKLSQQIKIPANKLKSKYYKGRQEWSKPITSDLVEEKIEKEDSEIIEKLQKELEKKNIENDLLTTAHNEINHELQHVKAIYNSTAAERNVYADFIEKNKIVKWLYKRYLDRN